MNPKPRRSYGWLSSGMLCIALSVTLACARSAAQGSGGVAPEEARPLSEVLFWFDSPCPRSSPTREIAAARTEPQVFLEMALIEVPRGSPPSTNQDGATLARVPNARLIGTPHLVVPLDASPPMASMTIGEIIRGPGALPEPGLFFKGVTVSAKQAEPNHLALELDVELETEGHSANSPEPSIVTSHVRGVVAPREGQAVRLEMDVPDYDSGRLVIMVKPYLIQDQIDLQEIFVCKMRQRQRYLESIAPSPR